jgi:hypothetical protein
VPDVSWARNDDGGGKSYLEEIPPGVLGSLRMKIVTTLSKGIQKLAEDAKKEEDEGAKAGKEGEVQRAGDALAKVLGCVSDFFEVGSATRNICEGKYYRRVPLKAHVRDLSVGAMAALLGSEGLQIKCEDEPYSFLCSWLNQRPKCDWQALFKSLLPHIRFEHMTSAFLISVVSRCPAVNQIRESWSYILRRSHASPEEKRANRGKGQKSWTFSTSFSLQELAGLEKDVNVYKYVGIAGGFPVYVNFKHTDEDTMKAYVGVRMPRRGNLVWEGEPEPLVTFSYSVTVAGGSALQRIRKGANAFDGRSGRGWNDFFKKPWQEIVVDGSPYLVDNKLNIEVTMEME